MMSSDYPGFRVTFWGTRGSIPTPGVATRLFGGNTSCVSIRANDMLIICDAGTGIRELGLCLAKEKETTVEGHLFMSHAHWDHIQGFPFFPNIYDPSSRFFVYEIEESDQRNHRLLSGQMQSDYFPVSFSDLGAHIEPVVLDPNSTKIGSGLVVRLFELPHPGRCHAYSFEKDGCRVVYSTDCELDLELPDLDETIADPDPIRKVSKDYLSFISGADLLIIDSQYFDEEYPSKRGWGHPRATTAVDAGVLGGVDQLALFHHDPMHSDDDVKRKVAICRDRAARFDSKLQVFGARERLQIAIEPHSARAIS